MEQEKDCLFCKIIKGEIPSFKVYEDEFTYAFLDINPANKHHTLVIPKKHNQNIFDIDEETHARVSKTVSKVSKYMKEELGIENINIMVSNGTIARQEIFHLHYHIIPRYENDNNNVRLNHLSPSKEELEETVKDFNKLNQEK